MNLPIILLGAGGHAKVLLEALQLCQANVIGATDPDPQKEGMKLLGVPIIGTDEILCGYSPAQVRLVNGLGSTSLTAARTHLFKKFKGEGFAFASVVHPAAVLARDVCLGEGTQIMAGVVVQPGVVLGQNVIVNTRASVDHDSHIGDHCHLAPGVTLSGQVSVGEGTHLGTGAVVIQGVQIGNHCVVGAGSLVLRDIPDGVTAYGSPAKGVA